MNWQRARNTEQIDQRRQKLLEMAAALLDEMDYQDISLAMVAERAGIAKSGVYRYFESKEMIYLRLWIDKMEKFVNQSEIELAPFADNGDPRKVAEILVNNVVIHPRFWNLLAVASSMLEHNVSMDSLVEIKTESLHIFVRLANSLKATFPTLSMEKIQQLIMGFSHLVVSGWYTAHPPEMMKELHKRPEFSHWDRDSTQDLIDSVYYLLRGILADSSKDA